MQYIERTQLVLAQIRQQPDLLEKIRHICHEHFYGNPWVLEEQIRGAGTTRLVYDAGVCNIPNIGNINLLLKAALKGHYFLDFNEVSGRDPLLKDVAVGERAEFGAFEVYYSFAAGLLQKVESKSDAEEKSFKLDDWDGTRVGVGDIGAIPFFHMAVRCGEQFCVLTEGLPPLIAPLGTAWSPDYSYRDTNTTEEGRIIDLGAAHSLIMYLNGEYDSVAGKHPDNFGLIARGQKYFDPENCLEFDE